MQISSSCPNTSPLKGKNQQDEYKEHISNNNNENTNSNDHATELKGMYESILELSI